MQDVEAEVAPRRKRKPEWVRLLEEDADVDEDAARVLEGADGDPEKIRENMRSDMASRQLLVTRQGVEKPPRVAFREVNPFGLWVWLEFHNAPGDDDIEVLDSVMRAWFVVGKLGGFNTQNLQVFQGTEDEKSFFEYANEDVEESMGSYLHDVTAAEGKGRWARLRIDMGTCDELAIDVLLNMLFGYSKDHAGLRRIFVGGTNSAWPTPEEAELEEAGERGAYPKVGMNPMKLPEGVSEELELLDELMAEERERSGAAASRARGAQASPAEMDARIANLDEEIEALLGDTDAAGGEADGGMVGSGRGRGRRGVQQSKVDDFRKSFDARKGR